MSYDDRDRPPTIEERYASSVVAHDLTMREERAGPVDTLTAAGMVGVRHPLSLSLWRWMYAGDKNERSEVVEGLVKWMVKQSRRNNWNDCGYSKIVTVSMAVADWYKHGICKTCNGTKYTVRHGTPILSDTHCPTCHGTGKTSLDAILASHGHIWIKRGHELSAHIDNLISEAAAGVLRKTKQVIDMEGL